MAKVTKRKAKTNTLSLTRITRAIYFLLATYIASIVIFDSGNLITKDAVIDRATLAFSILVINTAVWFMAAGNRSPTIRDALTYALVAVMLVFAGLTTYWERGMASTSTIFYALPLLAVGTLKHRHALIATATLAAGTYCFAAVKYFNDFFNEGYRVQLWGNLALYSGVIFCIAWLIMIITDLNHDSR